MLKENNKDKDKLLFLGIFFVIMISFLIFDNNKNVSKNKYKDEEIKKENIIFKSEYLNNINNISDNYEIKYNMLKDDKKYDLTIFSSYNMKAYSSSYFDNDFLIYNNQNYYINNDEIVPTNDKLNILMPEYYYDINVIKKVLNECTFIHDVKNSYKCSFPIKRYLELLDYKYDENNNDTFDIKVYLKNSSVYFGTLDYTLVDKILSNSNSDSTCEFEIFESNENYSEIIKYYLENN